MEELIEVLKTSRDFWMEESKYWQSQYKQLMEFVKKIVKEKGD